MPHEDPPLIKGIYQSSAPLVAPTITAIAERTAAMVHATRPGFSLWSCLQQKRRKAPTYQGIVANMKPIMNRSHPMPRPQQGRRSSRGLTDGGGGGGGGGGYPGTDWYPGG